MKDQYRYRIKLLDAMLTDEDCRRAVTVFMLAAVHGDWRNLREGESVEYTADELAGVALRQGYDYDFALSLALGDIGRSRAVEAECLPPGAKDWQPMSAWRSDELRKASDLASALRSPTEPYSKVAAGRRGRPPLTRLTGVKHEIALKARKRLSEGSTLKDAGRHTHTAPKTLKKYLLLLDAEEEVRNR